MSDLKQQAIVIGGVNYSDSSRVLWLITPGYGRQSMLVRGARRARSRFAGRMETFNLLEVVYRKNRSGTLHTLREADVQNQFPGLRASLEAFMAASGAVEMIKNVAPEDQECVALFQLLEDFLCCADEAAAEEGMPALLLAAFGWRLLSLLGLEPQLVNCIRCGERLGRCESYRFQPATGGVVCSGCAGDPAGVTGRPLLIGYGTLRFIYRSGRKFPLVREELSALSRQELAQVQRAVERYSAYHLGEKRPGGSRQA